MLRQTRLHHGLRNELKDSAGWTCLDSKEAVGSRTAAPELQQVLPAPQAALAASAGIACWEAHVPQGHSDSRGDRVRVVHRVQTPWQCPVALWAL